MTYPNGILIHIIWDEIAYLLHSTKDLLSLALTCRTLKNLIIPDHIEYRHIHCHIRREDVWEHLECRPRLTRGVRSLHLLTEYPTDLIRLPVILEPRHYKETNKTSGSDVPKWNLRSKVTKENLDMFLRSLSHMTLLREFEWNQNQGYTYPQEIIDISSVLTNTTHCLEALSMRWYNVENQWQFQTLSVNIWKLSGLKRVILQYPCPAAIQMIVFCPDIEDLYLLRPTPDSIYNIMGHANWKKLRRLSICETYPSPRYPIFTKDTSTLVTSFFDRHANLESLVISGIETTMPTLPSSCLPNLRSVSFDHENLATSFLSNETISRLVHLDCPIDDVDADNLPQLNNLETFRFQFISWNCIVPDSFLPLLLKARNLKKLHMDMLSPDMFYEDLVSCSIFVPRKAENANIFISLSSIKETEEEMIQMFLQCPSLTHLFCDLPGPEEEEELDEFCERFSALPNLKILELNPESKKRIYVKLERDEEGMYSRYQYVSLEEAERDVDSWGNFFLHLSD
ncbi:hypothetical protein Clacol_007025 [Clathrus columnatus]|uniref:F-box domain-containing protein n=1 Tax=Clathrus columnatus TaxID=1419009 RepID=A0AAV5AEW8_9AGAM|nr:hypothetical protein Clacol_007025 [Clathrus columnatus]